MLRKNLANGSMAKGFTLIELLVVIAIVGLLSAVVLASLNLARERGRLAGARSFAAQIDRVAGELLVGKWDFDDCSGTNAQDTSGYGNTGTLTSSPAWSSDTPSGTGCAISMNGTTQAVTINGPNSTTVANFGLSTDFTLSVWVKAVSLVNTPFIIDRRGTFGGISGGYTLHVDGVGRPCLRLGDSTSIYSLCATTGSFNDGKWHHYAASAKRTGSVTLYGDGQVVGSSSISGVGNIDSAVVLHFGTKDWGAGNAINGLIDGVHIFAKELTALEIQKIYALGLNRGKFAEK